MGRTKRMMWKNRNIYAKLLFEKIFKQCLSEKKYLNKTNKL